MQRACAAALLCKGETLLHNPGKSNDDLAALEVITKLGATVAPMSDGTIKITSNGIAPQKTHLHCGESGLGVRMFTPLAALSDQTLEITGEGSLTRRPLDFFDHVFPQLGVEIISNGGKLPLRITGPLQPTNIVVDGSLSSQFLTGLLMAYSAANASGVSITVENLKSKPYVDLTLHVMQHFGMKIPRHNDYREFIFDDQAQPSPTAARTYIVEGDWSGAAFLLVAGAVAGAVEVVGLDPFSAQADKAILQALMEAGAILSITPELIAVRKARLKPFYFDATECPDLFPPLVVLAAYANGKSVIAGVSRLTHKESNRALTLQQEFGKMGVPIMLQDDLMVIEGGQGVNGASVFSHHDHRIAMACAVAGLGAEGATDIAHADAVNKSYPAFFYDIQSLGADVSLTH